MDRIQTREATGWDSSFSELESKEATVALEQGKVLYFPHLAFPLTKFEQPLLSSVRLAPGVKNVSYNPQTHMLKGLETHNQQLFEMVQRFSIQARLLIDALFPTYTPTLIQGRTSFRPAKIEGRSSSYRKDDTRLHVDAFPSTPNQGKRLLRVFSNVNLQGQPRVWRLGEPFEEVARRFLPKISKPLPGSSHVLNALGITKSRRTLYDHYMLHLHNRMKKDLHYQKDVPQIEFSFPPQTTWIVMTDQVSHAAMAGQHMLEQTFYLPISGMMNENLSPLRILEKISGQRLMIPIERKDTLPYTHGRPSREGGNP